MPYRELLGISPGTEPKCDARELQQRLAFLGMTPEDAEQLRALKPMFQKHLAEFAEAFYGHLFAFEATAKFLTDPARVERLKTMQQANLMVDRDENKLSPEQVAHMLDAKITQRETRSSTKAR